jgi:hypothetical protein
VGKSYHRWYYYQQLPPTSKNSDFNYFFRVENQWILSEFFSLKHIRQADQLF